jgi:hypothetical protein
MMMTIIIAMIMNPTLVVVLVRLYNDNINKTTQQYKPVWNTDNGW